MLRVIAIALVFSVGVPSFGQEISELDTSGLIEISDVEHVFDDPQHDHGGDVGGAEHAHDSLHDWLGNRPDTHAPAALMGDHVHAQGEWMFEYKFMTMFMDDNLEGHTKISDTDVFSVTPPGTFLVTPTQMWMDMHMLHFMYGYTDNITLYIMPQFYSMTMDHLRANTTTFRTHNEGFADLRFGALWKIYEGCNDEVILNLGMSAPTGDIDNRTAGGAGPEFPYPMRLGTGTFDLLPGITYKRYSETGSFGAQFQTYLPLGENDNDYSVGEEFKLNFWIARLFGRCDQFAATFRVETFWRENYDGADPGLVPLEGVVSTARPDMRKQFATNLGYGLIWRLPGGSRLNTEISHPIYQDMAGVQLETDYVLNASWSKGF